MNHLNRMIGILFMIFICLTTVEDAAKTRKTKTTNSEKQTGFLSFISNLMAPEKVVRIEMESIRRDTLTYAKMRMLYYFQRLDHELFLDKKFSKTKILERVPSKGIRPSLQWQDIKSAWGLPLARNHLGLYVRKEKLLFGLYTRNFIKPIRRVKRAFFKVFDLYAEKIQEHFNKKTHIFDNALGVKKIPDSDKLLTKDKYIIYKETKALLDDLPPEKVLWSAEEMIIFKEFMEMFGNPPVEVPQVAGDWDEGFDSEEDEKEDSSSGTDYNSDDPCFRLPPESDNSDISDKEDDAKAKAIEEQLDKKVQEIAREGETETEPETRAESATRMESSPGLQTVHAPVTRIEPLHGIQPTPGIEPTPRIQPVPRIEQETTRSQNQHVSESEYETETDSDVEETGQIHSAAPIQQAGISAEMHSSPPTHPLDKISDDELKGIQGGPGEYLKTMHRLDDAIKGIICDPEQRKIIEQSDPSLKTSEILPRCEELEKSKQQPHHQTAAHPTSDDGRGFTERSAGGRFNTFFGLGGHGLGKGAAPPTPPKLSDTSGEGPSSEVAKPHTDKDAAAPPNDHEPSPTSAEHPTTDRVLDTPPEPEHKDDETEYEDETDDEEEEDEESGKEHSATQTQPTHTPEPAPLPKPETPATPVSSTMPQQEPSGQHVQQLLRPHDPRSLAQNLQPAEGYSRTFHVQTVQDSGSGQKMEITVNGKLTIEPKPVEGEEKYNLHHASKAVVKAIEPVPMTEARTEVFENPTPAENNWWLPSISEWFA